MNSSNIHKVPYKIIDFEQLHVKNDLNFNKLQDKKMGVTTLNTSDCGKGNYYVCNLGAHDSYEGCAFAPLHLTTCASTTISHSLLHLFPK